MGVDTLLPMGVDRLLRFVQRSEQPLPIQQTKYIRSQDENLVILHRR